MLAMQIHCPKPWAVNSKYVSAPPMKKFQRHCDLNLQGSYSYKHIAIKTHPKWIFLKLNWPDILGRFFWSPCFIIGYHWREVLNDVFNPIIWHRISTKISRKKTLLFNRFEKGLSMENFPFRIWWHLTN